MRITQNMLNSTMMRNLNSNLNRMDRLQDMLASSKKISKPSHDPVIASRGMLYRTTISENEQFRSNTGDAVDWLNSTETAISEAQSILARVKELITQASNDTMNPGDREKIRDEIVQLREHLGNVANTTLSGRYLFSGTDTDKVPFNSGIYTNTNTDAINLEVSLGIHMPTNVNGVQLFGQSDESVPSLPIVNPSDAVQREKQAKYEDSWQTDLFGMMNKIIDVLKPSEYATDAQGNLLAADPAGKPIYDSTTGKAELYVEGSGDTILKKEAYLTDRYGRLLAADDKGAPLFDPLTRQAQLYTGSAPADKIFKNEAFVRDGNGQLLAADASGNPVFSAGKVQPYISGTSLNVLKFSSALNLAFNQTGDVVAGSDPSAKTPLTPPENKMKPVTGEEMSGYLEKIQYHIDNFLQVQAQVGSRINRLELIQSRLDTQNENLKNIMSEGEDADMAEVIMALQNSENVHRAALASGSRIIQPTLLDFLR